MAVAFRAQQTAQASGGNNPSMTMPAGIQASDLLLLWGAIQANTVTAATPSGWTLLGSQVGTSNGITYLWWKKATSSDGGAPLTMSLTTGGATPHSDMLLLAYSGADTTGNPLFAQALEATSQTTHATPSLAGVLANSMIVEAASDRAATTTSSWTVPSGFTQESIIINSGTASPTIVAADKLITTAGTYGGDTFTANQATNNATMWTVGLAPAGSFHAEYILQSGSWVPMTNVRLSGGVWS